MIMHSSFGKIWTCLLLQLIAKSFVVQGQNLCPYDYFACTNGQCITSEKQCDGAMDCADKSDENCCIENSNSGREFAIAFLSHGNGTWYLSLFLTSSRNLTYTVDGPSPGISRTGSVLANQVQLLDFNISLTLNSGIEDKGILVSSTEDMSVVGLSEGEYSTDAFLALPTSLHGQKYIIASYRETEFGKSLFAVVGIQDHTVLTVQLSSSAFDGRNNFEQGETVSYTINRLQTLQIQGADLTGSLVVSSKPVSVFGGHQCANVPGVAFYCDHLVAQLPPTSTFGRRFATVPVSARKGGDVFRIVAPNNDTVVKVDGKVRHTINEGQFFEMDAPSSSYLSIETSQPVLVVQFSTGASTDNVSSDPFMTIVPPLEHHRSTYLIATPPDPPFVYNSFAGLVIRTSDMSGLRLDNRSLPSSASWSYVKGEDLVATSIPISNGKHRFHHIRGAKFGLMIDGYINYTSYGYPGGLQGLPYCSCQSGYIPSNDKLTCNDIDECNPTAFIVKPNNCSQLCVNIPGSFLCNCTEGYYLAEDGISCTDLDECTADSPCHQNCVNTQGSYHCYCHSGYTLSEDRISCADIDECEPKATDLKLNNCSQRCVNNPGSFLCECRTGYYLDEDDESCNDIDECASDSTCDHICVNTYGSYRCSCYLGYVLDDEGSGLNHESSALKDDSSALNYESSALNYESSVLNYESSALNDKGNCKDIDECADLSLCDHICVNTEGSFSCSCPSGYMLNNDSISCKDVDECSVSNQELNNCSQLCINVPGSFLCNCTAGYYLDDDRRSCRDIDECSSSPCHHSCVNTQGSYRCFCQSGFKLKRNGQACEDINECTDLYSAPCHHHCANTKGSYRCSCQRGYVLGSDGKTCEDVDECSLGTHDCTGRNFCLNVPGSYECRSPEATFVWYKSLSSPCSVRTVCGVGNRSVRFSCIEINNATGEERAVNDTMCVAALGIKPNETVPCGDSCKYVLGDWSVCNKDCVKTRQVQCVKMAHSGREEPLDLSYCNEDTDIPPPRPPPSRYACSGDLCYKE